MVVEYSLEVVVHPYPYKLEYAPSYMNLGWCLIFERKQLLTKQWSYGSPPVREVVHWQVLLRMLYCLRKGNIKLCFYQDHKWAHPFSKRSLSSGNNDLLCSISSQWLTLWHRNVFFNTPFGCDNVCSGKNGWRAYTVDGISGLVVRASGSTRAITGKFLVLSI